MGGEILSICRFAKSKVLGVPQQVMRQLPRSSIGIGMGITMRPCLQQVLSEGLPVLLQLRAPGKAN